MSRKDTDLEALALTSMFLSIKLTNYPPSRPCSYKLPSFSSLQLQITLLLVLAVTNYPLLALAVTNYPLLALAVIFEFYDLGAN